MPSPCPISLTMADPAPYTSEDMFREPSEAGRSLHDDANLFYRKVMGLVIPIKAVDQPSINDIHDAIAKKVSATDLYMWGIVYGLQLSQVKELWPGASTSPQNSVGKLWVACRNFGAAALRFHHAENVHNIASQKVSVVTPSKHSLSHSSPSKPRRVLERSRTSTAKKLKISTLNKSSSQKSLMSPTTPKNPSTPKKSPPQKGGSPATSGKRKGSKNWSTAQTTLLLDMVDDILPTGKEVWEQVVVQCHEVDESWVRPGESCKAKFEKMVFAKQPTGQSDIPLYILR